MTGQSLSSAQAEVVASVERLFSYAAWADKYGGNVQETTLRGITVGVPSVSLNELWATSPKSTARL